ncbi:MAG TPA: PQQ-binding-like beta-propeller repeat protein [Bacillales bacterium]|nr:PQQ-binding-like beta-propeller repeat protein [Bacillales bacterium]
MKHCLKAAGIMLLAGGIVLSGCGGAPNNAGSSNNTKNTGNHKNGKQNQGTSQNKAGTPTPKKGNKGFPLWGYDLQQTRHVPYKKITRDNVKKLGVVWQADLTKWDPKVPNAQEDYPVIVNGVMYVTSADNYVFAIDAGTGKKKWEWKPPKKVLKHINSSPWQSNVASRGVAVANGHVFVLITDDRLAKLDAKTGKLIKMVNFWDFYPKIKMENRHYESNAPMYYDGNIYVGSSGGDNGARGFVLAFKASNLKPAWDKPFWTIPPKGKKWRKGKFTGGGSVWTPMTFDPETDLMYFSVGNPSPDFFGKKRTGKNPHTDSVVALNSKTGKFVWAGSEMDHDVWDYDAAAPPMLINAKVNGKKKKLVVEGGKNGKWYAWDAKTGKPIYDGVPFVKIKHSPPPSKKGKAKLQWPGTLGGENYAPETYDPKTNYVLIPGNNSPVKALAAEDQSEIAKSKNTFPGTKILPSPKGVKKSGNITAIDVNTGKKVYQKKTDTLMRGGLTSTTTGLAFYADLKGRVHAINIKDGKTLWSMKSGGKQIKMAPTIYMDNGKEYVAVITGGTSIVVYGLGGKKQLKNNQNAKFGKTHGNEKKGNNQQASANPKAIFEQHCSSCHGKNLQGGIGPNLQHIGKSMSKQQILSQIKNGSGRMPAGLIKGKQADAVATWLSKKK